MPRRTAGVGGHRRQPLPLALAGLLAACTDARPAAEPAPSASSSGSQPTPTPAQPPPPAPPSTTPGAAAAPERRAGEALHGAEAAPAAPLPAAASAATPAASDAELAPPLLAADGTPLPQTRDRPDATSAGFLRRLELLVEAIAHDDPERALPAFFPVIAYQLVKAIPDPRRDWETRLVRAFRRDIREYHRLLGADAAGARLAGLVINERAVRWMEPGAEGNRVGYHRVTRSRLKIRLASGGTRELELTSLISWRGAWYVVHLHGFA